MKNLKHQLPAYRSFADLPIAELNTKKYSIYVIDYDWNYLFANTHAISLLGGREVIGKNVKTIWKERPEINFEPIYNLLKDPVAQRQPLDLKSRSPLTKKAIEIVGHPLEDCYFFSTYELPDKESLLEEIKAILRSNK